jgi:hypothetical protein
MEAACGRRLESDRVEKAGRTETRVSIRVHGLVPNGVYSLFYATVGPDSRKPLCSIERSLPLKSRNPRHRPDASSFVAARRLSDAPTVRSLTPTVVMLTQRHRVERGVLAAPALRDERIYDLGSITEPPSATLRIAATSWSRSSTRSLRR